jgi:riboflavin kinase, archaea type
VAALPQLFFEGTVFSGKGQGRRFVALPWVISQVETKLGFSPYHGTLNLRLTGQELEKRKLLDPKQGITIAPEQGFLPGTLYRACISGLECAVVVPDIPDYPVDVLEIISPIYLRGKLGLIDGRKVTVSVTV